MNGTVGIDVGGTAIKAVTVDDAGSVADHYESPAPRTAAEMVDSVTAIAERLGPGLAVGVGCNGLVDSRRGTLVWSPHIEGTDVPLGAILSARLGVNVSVGNDADMATLAEHRAGAGVGHDDLVMVIVGTGIGVGIVLDGSLRHGRAHAGEVGHITADPSGAECACGRRGCWETKVSGRRLDAEAVGLFGPGADGAALVEACRDGDKRAPEVLAEMGDWLAWGVEVLVLALDPALVILGGIGASIGDVWLRPVRARLGGTEGGGHRLLTDVTTSNLGKYAGAIGAALAVAAGGATTPTGLRKGVRKNV